MKFEEPQVRRLAALGILVYLGFYFFGWFMGVFSPGDVWPLTAIGVAGVLALGILALAPWRSDDEARRDQERDIRAARSQRERRGF